MPKFASTLIVIFTLLPACAMAQPFFSFGNNQANTNASQTPNTTPVMSATQFQSQVNALSQETKQQIVANTPLPPPTQAAPADTDQNNLPATATNNSPQKPAAPTSSKDKAPAVNTSTDTQSSTAPATPPTPSALPADANKPAPNVTATPDKNANPSSPQPTVYTGFGSGTDSNNNSDSDSGGWNIKY